ncbi:histidine phosphatase family protein [Ornithinimicrobium cavernae]|uniref:histidine phosphatase family protein n=1 Tax=Ornithinimicrobium cavernae TaxID=2666047 RepID=UPI000D69B1A7|nr:histidine phosphatase family protein [Ornithinimicrobium cavernae]
MTQRLILVRHGATEWSESGQHTGLTDLPLLPSGEEGARALRPLLQRFDITHVRSSPLQRAHRTAQLAGLEVDTIDPDLLEWDYGAYEGLSTAQVRAETGTSWSVWTHGVKPGATPGETVEEVAARASRVLATVAGIDGDVVLFGHGQALRILAAVFLRTEPRFGANLTFDTGALGILGHHREDPVIVGWNVTA